MFKPCSASGHYLRAMLSLRRCFDENEDEVVGEARGKLAGQMDILKSLSVADKRGGRKCQLKSEIVSKEITKDSSFTFD